MQNILLIKIIQGIFLLLFIFNSSIALAESRLIKILESGELRVGTTGDWNPMTIKDPKSNEYKGFDIDVVSQLAADMGVKITFIPTEWKTLVSGIISNKYDLTTSASLSEKRALSAGYTNSFFKLATVPLTLRENLEKYKTWNDINNQNVDVAVTLGTVQEQYAKILFPNSNIKIIEAPARDFQEVLAKRAHVHITSNVEAALLIQKYPQLSIIPVNDLKFPTPLAWLVPQDDQIWINYINHWIEIKKSRGFFNDIMKKWNLTSL